MQWLRQYLTRLVNMGEKHMHDLVQLSDQELQELAARARKAIFSAEYERFGTYEKAEYIILAARREQQSRQKMGEEYAEL
jgi:hypothetical protein